MLRQSVYGLAQRNPTFPAQEVRVACDVGLRCASPTYNPASVKCSCMARLSRDRSGLLVISDFTPIESVLPV